MLSQSQIKHITALKVKKFREEFNQFLAEGHKLVLDLVNSGYQIEGIYGSGEWILANFTLLREKKIPAFETLPREMDRISGLATPSPVLAVVQIPGPVSAVSMVGRISVSLTLALDEIRDPGNMGTIIRVADWFGIETILCSENCVDVYNPKVVQASMGSITRVQVISCNLVETLRTLTGSATPANGGSSFPIYGTFLEGDSVFSTPLSVHGIIVIGNESRGISPALAPLINHKIVIPSYGSSALGKAESLNASIATAIVCAEFRREKLEK
jgi:TrmH family RNA methyltransferase